MEATETVITDEIRWNKLSLRRFELGIVDAFNAFRAHGIEPILLKGWAAARNYPEDHPRPFGDVDLAVSANLYERTLQLIEGPEFQRVGIDLHREFRHLDTTPWNILYDRSELIDIDGTLVRILRPEDHLRVLCVHWLTDGGAYKERLWDIYYAVANRPPDFDWDVCLGSVSATRRKWVITTIGLAREYLELDVSDLPFAEETVHIPQWMTKCLLKEWSSEERLRPLHACLHDLSLLLRQIAKRIPPNPIQATIDTEGEFDDRSRIFNQIGSIVVRTKPSVNRVFNTLLGRPWK